MQAWFCIFTVVLSVNAGLFRQRSYTTSLGPQPIPQIALAGIPAPTHLIEIRIQKSGQPIRSEHSFQNGLPVTAEPVGPESHITWAANKNTAALFSSGCSPHIHGRAPPTQ
jgi:hypothetical protein